MRKTSVTSGAMGHGDNSKIDQNCSISDNFGYFWIFFAHYMDHLGSIFDDDVILYLIWRD